MKGFWNITIANMKKADIVIEVVDARAISATRSRKLERLATRLGKKLMIVINKRDLAPSRLLEEEHERIKQEIPCIFISTRERQGMSHMRKMISMMRPKDRKDAKVCIIGYPNTGKSSLINILTGKHAAPTAPVPGKTRGEQWIRMSQNTMLYDTPGVIPMGEDTSIINGFSIPEKVRDPEDKAEMLLDMVFNSRYSNLEDIYGITKQDIDSGMALEKIALLRGCIKKGGKADLKRAAKNIIVDWNAGKIKAFIR